MLGTTVRPLWNQRPECRNVVGDRPLIHGHELLGNSGGAPQGDTKPGGGREIRERNEQLAPVMRRCQRYFHLRDDPGGAVGVLHEPGFDTAQLDEARLGLRTHHLRTRDIAAGRATRPS